MVFKIVTTIPLEKIKFKKSTDVNDAVKIDKLNKNVQTMGKIRWLRSYDKVKKQVI